MVTLSFPSLIALMGLVDLVFHRLRNLIPQVMVGSYIRSTISHQERKYAPWGRYRESP